MTSIQVYPSALGFSIDYPGALWLIDSTADPPESEISKVSGPLALTGVCGELGVQPSFISKFDYTLWITLFESSVDKAVFEVVAGQVWGDGMYAMLNLLRDFVFMRYQDALIQSSQVAQSISKMLQMTTISVEQGGYGEDVVFRIKLIIGLMRAAAKHFEVGDLR